MVFVYTSQNNVNAGDPGPDIPCTNRNCLINYYTFSNGLFNRKIASAVSNIEVQRVGVYT